MGENIERKTDKKRKFPARDIAMIGLMVAVIEVSKLALGFLPNIELTSFWLILFTLLFGWKIAVVIPMMILIEGCMYGFGLWWLMYLYSWPLLVVLAWMFRRQESVWFWAVLSGAFGLCFGALGTAAYFFVGASQGTLSARLSAAFAWWVAGIPWDIVHCIGNFTLMLFLYRPFRSIVERIRRQMAGFPDGHDRRGKQRKDSGS